MPQPPPISNRLTQPGFPRPPVLAVVPQAESPATRSCTEPASAGTVVPQSQGTARTQASRPAGDPRSAQDRALRAERIAKDSRHTTPSRTELHPHSDSHGYTREPCGSPDAETRVSLGQRPG